MEMVREGGLFPSQDQGRTIVSQIDYSKYLVTRPLYENLKGVKNRQSPVMTYLSSRQVPEANYLLNIGWVTGIPEPNPHIYEHVHDYDEIILNWGGDYRTPQDLGAEIVMYVGGQPIRFNTTTSFFIPRGVPHGPMIWNKFERPHVQMSLMLGTGSYEEAFAKSGIDVPKKSLPKKTVEFDYEQYAIRSPIREAGAEFIKGRTAPTMTYMSGLHIPGVKYYIEFGWTFDMPVTRKIIGSGDDKKMQMPAMAHKNFEELVLHIGGDPENPEDLGGDMVFWVGGQPLEFNKSSALFIPKGVLHGPIKLNKYEKPHIVMAIMLGAGNVKDGWEGSFIEGKQ